MEMDLKKNFFNRFEKFILGMTEEVILITFTVLHIYKLFHLMGNCCGSLTSTEIYILNPVICEFYFISTVLKILKQRKNYPI